MKNKLTLLLVLALVLSLVFAFTSCGGNNDTDTNTETETISESDTSTGTDTEVESDSNTEIESDTETETEVESDTNTETESDTETETEVESDSNTETESDTETETEVESDSDTETETDTETDEPEHVHTEEIIPAVEPTCTEEGLTEGKKCSECDETLVEQTVVEALGHTYENSYTCSHCSYVSAIESIGLEFTLNSETDTYEVSGIGTCTDADIVIPYTHEEKLVTRIRNYAFANCIDLTSATIPNSITSIGEGTFYQCRNLTSITIPNSVTSIGASVFYWCDSLTNVIIHDNITSIRDSTFYGCGSLTSITIPNGVTSIGTSAFYGCDSLTSITIPESVTSIGKYAFYACGSLTSIIIPDSVTRIGECAFQGCISLRSVIIPNSVTTIGVNAFRNCDNLTSITIPESVTSIGKYAFEGCRSLTSIIIPSSVTSIGDDAFRSCFKLVEVYNLSSFDVSSYFDYAKVIHTSLDEESILETIDGYIFMTYSDKFYLMGYVGNETELTLPENYKGNNYEIYQYALYCRDDITKVTISKSVTSIGACAFRYCISLTSVNIPNSVTSIGDDAFYGCTGLTNITIPDSVTSIGENAFCSCDNLTSITIPSSVTTIGEYAFSGCYNLTIYCETTSMPSGWNYYWNGSDCPVVWGYEYTTVEDIVYGIKDNVATVVRQPRKVIEINIPASITYKDVVYPVTSIGDHAFLRCTGLTNITIPDSVTSIGENAFCSCDNLTSITIPSSVTTIGEYAFSGCYNLTIYCETTSMPSGWNYYWNGSDYPVVWGCQNNEVANDRCIYTIIDGIRYGIKNNVATVVRQSRNVVEVNIPASITYKDVVYPVTSIGYEAFYHCYSLTSITIPNSVTSIGDEAFYSCGSLTSITIPDSVTSIGYGAFSSCANLTIYCEATSMPSGWDSNWKSSYCPVVWGYEYTTVEEIVYGIKDNVATVVRQPRKVIEVNIPASITYKDIVYPVTSIGYEAFYHCYSLTSITIPSSVTSIGKSAFLDCTALAEINFNAKAMDNLSPYDGVFYNAGNNGDGIKVIIGKEVTKIPACLFHCGHGDIDNIIYYSPRITSVEFEEGSACESIGNYAFLGCTGLTSVTIPDSVTSIEYSAFHNCTSLTSITIPNSVTSIGDGAFYDCTSLTSVNYVGTIEEWFNIEFGYSFGYSYTNPLYYAKNLYLNGELVTELVIPNTVNEIKAYAFCNCISLTSVIIPSSVTSIGINAFEYCYKLVEVYNLSSFDVSSYFDYAKVIHTSLDEESILETVNDYIFMTWEDKYYLMGYVGNKTELTLPENYKGNNYEIYQYAFYCRDDIVKVTIPDSVTSIGNYAFYNCTALTEINFNAIAMDDLSCDNYVFFNAGKSGDGIKVTIGKDVTKIPAWLFYHSSYYDSSTGVTIYYIPKITSVIFEEGSICESIGTFAFYYCDNLTSIAIPSSVTTIGDYVFNGCTSLTIYCEATSMPSGWDSNWKSSDCPVVWGYEYTTVEDIIYGIKDNVATVVRQPRNVIEVNIPASITYKDVVYPVTSIGDDAFSSCNNLTSITIPSSVTSIGGKAFSGCTSLTSLHISNIASWCNIEFGGYDANPLCYADNLYINGELVTELVIPNTITEINAYAFYGCASLTSLHISDIASWCNIEFGEYDANPLCYADNLYINGELVTELVIPNTVTKIKAYAFYGCDSLTSVTIGNSVKSIGDGAFYSCYNLTSVDFEEGSICESIGNFAFYYCDNLTSITIPESVTSIGKYAFEGCRSLTSITIPDSVTSIGKYAFTNCTSLTSVTFEDPYEWYVTKTEGAASGTDVDLSDTSKNATYLKDTYDNYYWHKK